MRARHCWSPSLLEPVTVGDRHCWSPSLLETVTVGMVRTIREELDWGVIPLAERTLHLVTRPNILRPIWTICKHRPNILRKNRLDRATVTGSAESVRSE